MTSLDITMLQKYNLCIHFVELEQKMKKALRIILPILLTLAILLCIAWYLFIYDREFTRDMLLTGARYCESEGNHTAAAWFYNLAYRQAGNNDDVAIELAQQYKDSGNYTKAEFTLSNAIADGGGADLYVALCKTYVEQDKLLDAVNLLDTVCSPDSRVNPTVKEALLAMRPAAPIAHQAPGFYSQYISVTVQADKGTLYTDASGQYPSVHSDAYLAPIVLKDGENTIYAVSVTAEGLVSPLSIFGYTVLGVVEEVVFSDPAVENAVRAALGVTPDKYLLTNDLWSITTFTVPAEATTLADLKYLPFLKELTVYGMPAGQLRNISTLTDLETLCVINTPVYSEELSTIAALPKLQKLTLSGCSLSTISPLQSAKGITYLDISNNTLRNIQPLSAMTGLTEAYLQQNVISDLTALSSLTALKKLDVSYNELDDISPVFSVKSLQKLNFSNNRVSSLSGIEALTALTELSAISNGIADISMLSANTELTHLEVSNNALTDITGLSGLNKLQHLDFSHNKVKELPAFTVESQLITINGSYNLLESLDQLSGLTKLNNVYMDYNEQIKAIEKLAECPLLVLVNVYGTKVTEVKALTDLSIVVNYNPVQE